MGEMFATIPTTVKDWQGQNEGNSQDAEIIKLPQIQ
jgi:hypothetical protein